MAKSRSPNYPLIALDDAVEGARKVYKADYKNKVDKAVVAKHLGYGGLNGKSLGVISALLKYGLLDGRGELRVTDDAVVILVDQKPSQARQQAIRRAALRPALFAQLNTHFGGTMPSAENLSAYLQKNGFTPQAAGSASKSFRDTMAFVTQETDGSTLTNDEAKEDETVVVGDYVQWESQGTWQFDATKKLVGLSDDGLFGFVDGESTGIPMDQLIKAEAPKGAGGGRTPPASPFAQSEDRKPTAGVSREVFSLGNGVVALEWPDNLDAAGLGDVEDWLNLVMRKLKRLKAPTGRAGGENS